MTFEKTNHFLFKIFVFLLVLTQGIIFVTTRAAFDETRKLDAQFLLNTQQFTVGDIVPMQVNLLSEQDFALVYFNLQQEGADNFLQIQAVHDSAGLWSSDSSWDTSAFGAGNYSLSVRAITLDEAGAWEKTLVSDSLKLSLSPAIQAASQADEKITADDLTNVVAAIATSTEEAVEPLAEFVSPAAHSVINTDDVILDIALDKTASSTDTLGVSLYNLAGQFIKEYPLSVLASDAKRWQADFGEISQITAGEYYLVTWLNTKENFISSPLVFTVQPNQTEQVIVETNSDNYDIALLQPQENAVIKDNSVAMKFSTNFIADRVGVLMTKLDDASIGAEFIFTKVDGLNWDYVLEFNNDLINGDYILSVLATDENGLVTEKTFGITLERAAFDQGDLAITDLATSTEASASSTTNLAMCQTDADCVNLCSGCYATSSVPEVDCAAIPTGSCTCLANVCVKQELATSTIDLSSECEGEECPVLINDNNQQSLDGMCLAENIYEAVACEDYLNRTVVDLLCQKRQIFDPMLCRQYLAETYAGDIICADQDLEQCRDILENNYLNRLVNKKLNQSKLNDIVKSYINQSVSFKNLQSQLVTGNFTDAAPLINGEQNIFLLSAQDNAILFGSDKLVLTTPAVILLDSDKDALTDDLELYYGSDPKLADTDNDGYPDGLEVKNNYNPNGSGVLEQAKTTLDEILANAISIEQPKTSLGKTNNDWKITVSDVNQDESLNLSGTATPNTWLNIFIYSELPLVLSTKTDALGRWSYPLALALVTGTHEVYAVAHNAEGQILSQSLAADFVVKEKAGANEADTADTSVVPVVSTEKKVTVWFYYFGGGVAILLVAVAIFIWRKKRMQTQV